MLYITDTTFNYQLSWKLTRQNNQAHNRPQHPLLRGTYALAMVVGYLSKNRAASMLSQYSSILVAVIYCASLILYYQELPVNPNVKTFWDALYWSCMYVTAVGCSFSAVTVAGKIISVMV